MISHEIPYSVNPRYEETTSKSLVRLKSHEIPMAKVGAPVLHLHSAEHRCSGVELPQSCDAAKKVLLGMFFWEKNQETCGVSFSGTDILVGIIIQNLINTINHGVLFEDASGFSQKGNVHFIKDGV